ncbi:MAG: hypothetical protein JSV79_09535, partial [Armatimonadota bacterium]
AGRPDPGYRDGEGHRALFDGPVSVTVDRRGVAYLADSRNHTVRVVSAKGEVTTLTGAQGEPGHVDGLARQARFSAPAGVAVASDGRVFVADTGNHRIRCITPGGVVSTYAGAETPRDGAGRFVGGYRDGPAAQAQFCYPVGLAVDERGVLYVADAGNHSIRRISPGGHVSTLPTSGAGELKTPTELALAPGNRIWVADTPQGTLWVGPRGGPLNQWPAPEGSQSFAAPAGIAVLGKGSARPAVYVADAANHCLWRVQGDELTLVAGEQDPRSSGWQDGRGDRAQFSSPVGLASAPSGDLYVADFGNNCLRQVTFGGEHGEAD